MNIHDKIKSVIHSMADEIAESLIENSKILSHPRIKMFESPIEELMWTALDVRSLSNTNFTKTFLKMHVHMKTDIPMTINMMTKFLVGKTSPGLNIFSQVKVDKYRVDFLAGIFADELLGAEGIRYLAIECDGHNFHERTKEQAARDRRKDRFLMANEISVMRFTGSQIWDDALSCAAEVINHFEIMEIRDTGRKRKHYEKARKNAIEEISQLMPSEAR